MYITRRLIFQPEVEFNVAVQEVGGRGIGSGLNNVDFGARLRYESIRELAPYVGINWT